MTKKKISGKVVQYTDSNLVRMIGIETKPAVQDTKDPSKNKPADRVVIQATNRDLLPVVSFGDTITIDIS